VSESARATSAAEARFRVQVPNSRPRAIKVVALDRAGEAAVRRLAGADWHHAALFASVSPDGTLTAVDGGTRSVADEVNGADLVVFVAGPGGHAHATRVVGEACSRRRVTTTGFLVGAASAPEPEISKTLAQIRPWSLMVVISRSDDYIADMMTALRA